MNAIDAAAYSKHHAELLRETASLPSSYPRDYQLITSKSESVIGMLPFFSGAKLVDVGCNFGMYSLLAAASALSVVGVDVSPDFVEIAVRSREFFVKRGFAASNITFAVRRVDSFLKGEFDAMLLCCVLYHLLDHEIEFLANYIRENCEKVLVQCRPARGELAARGALKEGASANGRFGGLYSAGSIVEFLLHCGMKEIRVHDSGAEFYGEKFPVISGQA